MTSAHQQHAGSSRPFGRLPFRTPRRGVLQGPPTRGRTAPPNQRRAIPSEVEGRRRDALALGTVGVVLLAVYLRTMARTAIEGDSAELVTTVHTLGIPHPTGYPLFAMVGKLFDLLAPIGTVAFRLNLFSALLGAATGIVIAWTYRTSGGRRPAAVLAGLTAGLLFVPWQQALSFEVYTMHALFSALALLAFLRWRLQPTPRRLVVLAGLGGLALSHHGTAVFVVVPLFIAALALHRPLTLRLVAKCAGAALLPFVAYAYLPLVSMRDPYVRWGDASTLTGFVNQVTGKMFWSYLGSHGAQRMEPVELLGWLLGDVRGQLTMGGAVLIVVGWLTWWRRDRAFWACISATLVLSLLWVSVYRVLDQAIFLIACFAIFGLWLAAGSEALAAWVAARAPAARVWVLGALVLAVPLKLGATNLSRVDLSTNWSLYDRTRLVLHHVRPNAITILRGHAFHSMGLYLQQCEGMRPDVAVVSSGLSTYEWYVTKHTDPIVVQGIRYALPALKRGEIPNPQLNWCPHLTKAIARLALPDRPLYVNQRFEPPVGYYQLAGPPINEMVTARPDLERPDREGRTAKADFPLGMSLLEATAEPTRVPPGGIFGLRLLWRCRQLIEQPVRVEVFFVLAGSDKLLTSDAVRFLLTLDERVLSRKERNQLSRAAFGGGHPLLYGLLPLEPNAAGHHYQRVVPCIASHSAAPGRYRIYLSVATEEQRRGPFAVGELTVVAGKGG